MELSYYSTIVEKKAITILEAKTLGIIWLEFWNFENFRTSLLLLKAKFAPFFLLRRARKMISICLLRSASVSFYSFSHKENEESFFCHYVSAEGTEEQKFEVLHYLVWFLENFIVGLFKQLKKCCHVSIFSFLHFTFSGFMVIKQKPSFGVSVLKRLHCTNVYCSEKLIYSGFDAY